MMITRNADSTSPVTGMASHEALTLNEAAAWIATETGCRRPHVSTLLRWILKGVRGERLPARRVGSKYWVHARDLAGFLDDMNAPARTVTQGRLGRETPSPSAVNSLRRQQVDAACSQLDRLLRGTSEGRSNHERLNSSIFQAGVSSLGGISHADRL